MSISLKNKAIEILKKNDLNRKSGFEGNCHYIFTRSDLVYKEHLNDICFARFNGVSYPRPEKVPTLLRARLLITQHS